ncbi:MAG: RsmB/NOP family class I SAM-dependent RNA methyltransferase [Nanoarchaeota archaeon]|nr:RsmB/NOP family class I SAM-dependent RNA methyltransferase [Nanoarchaeota archaeon]
MFKPKFVERYEKLMKDLDAFLEISKEPLRDSIRVNTLKAKKEELKERLGEKGWKLEEIPWYKYGFFVETEEVMGNSLEHVLGYFYVQEAVSMLPPIVLNPKPGEIVLDMCAAPGSKSTQIAMHMKNEGVLVTNDVRLDRIIALKANLQRCGVMNVVVTRMDGARFSRFSNQFDRVLVDAPCSATGAIRKSWKVLKMWNPRMVRKLSYLQKRLVLAGFDALKPNGILVYSTCTLEPEENEGVIDFLLRKREVKIEPIRLRNIKTRKGIEEFEGREYSKEVRKCVRIYPQDNDTEGFFIAKVRKL